MAENLFSESNSGYADLGVVAAISDEELVRAPANTIPFETEGLPVTVVNGFHGEIFVEELADTAIS